MAKLPDWSDLGATPNVTGSRPIGSYDVSPYARGAAAEAAAGANLGKAVADVGAAGSDVLLDQARYQYATAHADFLSKSIDLKSSLANDTDYSTIEQRYTDGINKIRDEAASNISLPGMRARFVDLAQPEIEQGVAGIRQHAFKLEGDANVADVQQQGSKFIDQGTAAPGDSQMQQKLIGAYVARVDGLAARGWISQEAALKMKQDWAHQYALADGVARSSTDPQGVINDLRAAPGSPYQIDNRIVQIESNGNPLARSKTSSAYGLGQFEPGTWLPLIRQAHPELADKSDADLLALRADRGLNMEMLALNRRQNTDYLTKNGVEASPGNIYLAHFLGPAGAAAVAKASPTAPIGDVLASAVGKDQAAKMIAANGSILNGQTAGGVAQWASDKMGGVGPGGGHIYDILRPDQRAMLLDHAQTALQRQTVTDFSDFQGRVKDSEAEAARTGNVTNPIGPEEFVARAGPVAGPQAYQQYQANIQLGRDVSRVAKLDPQEQAQLIQSYEPKAGDPGYADAVQRQNILTKAIKQSEAERKADPAQFAINRLAASGPAYDALQKATDPAAKTAAARNYASTTLMEQDHIGLPPEQQHILPKAYADGFNKAIEKASSATDPQSRVALINVVRQEASTWGEYWPQVMRELSPGVQPVVRAIAAGADDTAMTRILRLDPKDNMKSLLSDQPDTKVSAAAAAVDTAMAPLRATLLPSQRDGKNSDFEAYSGLAGKLTALYVRDGDDATTAATKAFNALIGNRYDFRDTYRIPKSAGVLPDDVQAGAQVARGKLGELGVQPAVNDIGVSNAAADSIPKFARDGKWVTAPDNSGLNLAYGDKFVRRTDGQPLKLSWSQLSDMAKANRAASAADPQSMVITP